MPYANDKNFFIKEISEALFINAVITLSEAEFQPLPVLFHGQSCLKHLRSLWEYF